MAEIYDFLAYKKKEEARKKTEEMPVSGEKIDYLKLTKLLSLLAKLISNDAGNPRRNTFQDEYDLATSYNNAEIIGWINNFDELKVTAKPLFYSALIKAAEDKQLISQNFG